MPVDAILSFVGKSTSRFADIAGTTMFGVEIVGVLTVIGFSLSLLFSSARRR